MDTNEELRNLLNSDFDIDSLSIEEIDELIPILEAETTPKLSDYVPQEKQKIFHCSSAKYRILLGGNRSGKTTCGAAEDAYHSTGQYPDWYPENLRLKQANQGRVIVMDYKQGAAIYEKRLLEYLSPELILQVKRVPHTGTLERIFIKHTSGGTSVIEILTHEQSDESFEGWNGHWVHFDEPPPRNKFVATIRGLIDLKGRCWMTMTPISQPWIYDQFLHEPDDNVFTLTIDIRDNATLTEAEIQDFENRLTEEEKEARLHGKFRHLTGLVYKEFDPNIHLVSQVTTVIDRSWPVYFSLDPADRRPHRGIWFRINPFGTMIVYDEIEYRGTIQQLSEQILLKEKMSGIKSDEVTRILDPNKGRSPEQTGSNLTIQDMFANCGLWFTTDVSDDVVAGHLAVQERLHWDKTKPISLTNCPKLYFIRETTKKCISQFTKYIWDDHKSSEKDPKEKPKDVNKDFPDTIRYGCIYNPLYIDPKESFNLINLNRITGWVD